ncbi:MarR family winged helix-turn-helix transcriptional regulator [Archangium lipolyticum]|uniref:MarR family winged helix-turn-helix transcriptional regulator n=1 Tax=Archangium lipolyticum TaxID=2970465 RepID=UPI00214A8632|nr:MarR family transcriptional regulator [Archangium lipolyticum]
MSRKVSTVEDKTGDVDRFRQLLFALGRLYSLRDPLASGCERMQLTAPQIHTLLWLGEDGALTMGGLARRLGITEKTVTGVVDRLEREGHVQRERNPEDRRVVHCRLTASGARMYRKLERTLVQGMDRLLGHLDLRDRRALFLILEKLIASAGPGETAAPGR